MVRPLLTDGFKIGLFAANCSSGMAVTTAEDRWSGSWEDNLRMAKIADEVGIDFLLPIARFIGYKGATNFHESVLDPVVWAAGLLANTTRISVVSTIHSAFNHPIVTAKQMATLDRISGGRAGLNIVAGWNKPEYDAMGSNLPDSHDVRYGQAQEWWDIIRQSWTTEGRFDWAGEYYNLIGAEALPKPVDGPLPVFNAGSSTQGRGFSARNANFSFTIVDGPEDAREIVRTIKGRARDEFDREANVLTITHAVVRPTEKEAREFVHWYSVENRDHEAVDNIMRLMGAHSQSFTPEMLAVYQDRFAAGHGSYPLVGTPDQVAERIKGLADAGLGGITTAFFNYADELPYFAEEVLPRLERLGVRAHRGALQVA